MTELERDIEASKQWLMKVASNLTHAAILQDNNINSFLDKASVIAACAGLPGDLPLRVRCLSNAFKGKA